MRVGARLQQRISMLDEHAELLIDLFQMIVVLGQIRRRPKFADDRGRRRCFLQSNRIRSLSKHERPLFAFLTGVVRS